MMLKRAYGKRGQVTVEVAVLFGVVVAGLVAMAIYFQRGIQGGVRSNADSFGQQFSATGAWTQTNNTVQATAETPTDVTTTQNSNLTYNQALP
jgi:uncharacterized protein (UPF0333 family)